MQLVINIENMYMNDQSRELPLLEYLSWKAGCEYLSDLHGISSVQKIRWQGHSQILCKVQ